MKCCMKCGILNIITFSPFVKCYIELYRIMAQEIQAKDIKEIENVFNDHKNIKKVNLHPKLQFHN